MHIIHSAIRALLVLIALVIATPNVLAQTQTVDRHVGAGFVLVVENLNLINKQGPNTADHIFYNPNDGRVTVGITQHPQFYGNANGVLGIDLFVRPDGVGRGDCWGSFATGVVGATTVRVADLDGDGLRQEILIHRISDGKWVEFKLSINDAFIARCDTTDAF